jgi:hypothetical protein
MLSISCSEKPAVRSHSSVSLLSGLGLSGFVTGSPPAWSAGLFQAT